MENLVLTRIDDRLIHGQVVTAWIPFTDAEAVMVVDDGVASDDFMVEILKTAAPKKIHIDVLSKEGALEALQQPLTKKTIILAKIPSSLEFLIQGGVDIPEIDVGGMGAREGRKVLLKNISISREEGECFSRLIDTGTDVFVQVMPTQGRTPVAQLLKEMG